jgi:hypothetical protein
MHLWNHGFVVLNVQTKNSRVFLVLASVMPTASVELDLQQAVSRGDVTQG